MRLVVETRRYGARAGGSKSNIHNPHLGLNKKLAYLFLGTYLKTQLMHGDIPQLHAEESFVALFLKSAQTEQFNHGGNGHCD